jgi:hypothetical protein
MSGRAINRSGWSPEERAAYDALLAEIVAESNDSTERLDLFEHKLNDAVQAHRPWAVEVERACLRSGMGKEISRFQDRERALVSYDGRVLSLPAVQARRVVDDRRVSYQRELIELWTWDQILDKRVEAIKSQTTYSEKVAHYDRLLALRVRAPQSSSPADAARLLGLDLDDYLAPPKAA